MAAGATRTARRRGQHGVVPLSAATRTRLLSTLLARAEAGDAPAAEALVRLSYQREAGAFAPPTIPPGAGAQRA